MINAIIVENEKPQSDYLISLLKKHHPEIEIIALAISVPEGIQVIKNINPDLVFLDVELPPYTGFDLIENTKEIPFEVIFTTSYNKYAVKAFEVCALHYLLKPYEPEDLKKAIDRFKEKVSNSLIKNKDILVHNIKQKDKSAELAGIPVLGGIDFIQVSDIIRCQSSNNYTDIFLLNKKVVTATKTLKWIENLLSEHYFFRVHDSHLINMNHIKTYRKGGEGGFVLLSDKHEVDVSRRKKDSFIETLSKFKMIKY